MKFTSTHEWVKQQNGLYEVGITEFAASELGDIVFVQLPEVGDSVVAGESFAEVESVKAVSPVLSPVSGKVVAINEDIVDSPENINQDALSAWFIKVEADGFGELISLEEYQSLIN